MGRWKLIEEVRKIGEPVNLSLRRHVEEVQDWEHAAVVKLLHEWAGRFIDRFGLDVLVPAIAVERLRRPRLGQYRLGRNQFGLFDEIVVDERHATTSPFWRVLGTLLHELLHGQQFHDHDRDPEGCGGKGTFHNKEYREMAAGMGLEVSEKGVTSYPPGETAFRTLLKEHKVDTSEEESGLLPEPPRTKLRLWECRCVIPVKLRIGRSDVHVRCLDCNANFVLVK